MKTRIILMGFLTATLALAQQSDAGLFADVRKREQLAKSDPKNPDHQYELARLYRKLAASCASRLRESNRDSARLAQLEAEAWMVQGRWDEALKSYGRAVGRAPSLAGSHLGIALVHLRKRDLAAARASLVQELEVAPDNAAAGALLKQLDNQRPR